MATSAPPMDAAHAGSHGHELSFIRKYIFSTDHKIIGIQFLLLSLTGLFLGGLMAMMIRWQLGFPEGLMPLGGLLPETMVSGGVLLPEFYNSLSIKHSIYNYSSHIIYVSKSISTFSTNINVFFINQIPQSPLR